MKNYLIPAAIAAAVLGGGFYLMRQPAPDSGGPGEAAAAGAEAPMVEVTVPALSPVAQMGETAFANVCAKCHGANAAGRDGAGPPLIHRIYVPGHHGDQAFHMAVANGVPAHHWDFGNMPPLTGLTTADVEAIVTYVRELQRANGIQ